jgi:hypothetical protein
MEDNQQLVQQMSELEMQARRGPEFSSTESSQQQSHDGALRDNNQTKGIEYQQLLADNMKLASDNRQLFLDNQALLDENKKILVDLSKLQDHGEHLFDDNCKLSEELICMMKSKDDIISKLQDGKSLGQEIEILQAEREENEIKDTTKNEQRKETDEGESELRTKVLHLEQQNKVLYQDNLELARDNKKTSLTPG